MNTISDNPSLFQSSLLGSLRGIVVHSLIFPLEVIKVRQQCAPITKTSYQIAFKIFQTEGMGSFYRGLKPQLLTTVSKQVWCWPLITHLPLFLQSKGLAEPPKQAITGLTISTVDAAITTPLSRATLLSAASCQKPPSIAAIYKEGWKGFFTYWTKLTVAWSSFLVAQKLFRDQERTDHQQRLNIPQLMKVAIKVSVLVSVCLTPFDLVNTLKQTEHRSLNQLFKGNVFKNLYRGWPVTLLCLTIHNVASIILIERLDGLK
ncbi:MAG: MC/SLC25 family protein [Verrucomicrobia bacterium]|nr:MC/SLC25 family protein [Verrucomicrobiota bacterium]MBS0646700.1 MC/SLC25 family protein [Verrucomicrobiota bacterium]